MNIVRRGCFCLSSSAAIGTVLFLLYNLLFSLYFSKLLFSESGISSFHKFVHGIDFSGTPRASAIAAQTEYGGKVHRWIWRYLPAYRSVCFSCSAVRQIFSSDISSIHLRLLPNVAVRQAVSSVKALQCSADLPVDRFST